MNKKTSESKTIYTYGVMPKDMNTGGTLYGPVLFNIADHNSGTTVLKHVRSKIATISCDSLEYLKPTYNGDFLTAVTIVSGVGKTSVETFTKFYREVLRTGEKEVVAISFLTFKVKELEPGTIPGIIPETEEEKVIIDGYEQRRKINKMRIEENKRIKKFLNCNY